MQRVLAAAHLNGFHLNSK